MTAICCTSSSAYSIEPLWSEPPVANPCEEEPNMTLADGGEGVGSAPAVLDGEPRPPQSPQVPANDAALTHAGSTPRAHAAASRPASPEFPGDVRTHVERNDAFKGLIADLAAGNDYGYAPETDDLGALLAADLGDLGNDNEGPGIDRADINLRPVSVPAREWLAAHQGVIAHGLAAVAEMRLKVEETSTQPALSLLGKSPIAELTASHTAGAGNHNFGLVDDNPIDPWK
jgi:hypothetical protein